MQLAPTNSGDQQTGTVGATLPQPLRVVVQRGSVAAPGVSVSWSAIQGSLSANSTTTDASGIASVLWTLGTLPGGQTTDARLRAQPGSPDTLALQVGFTALAIPGPASQLRFSVPPSNTFAGRPLLPAVQLSALDQFGNAATAFVGNVTLELGANASGGSLSGRTTIPAVAGVATFADLRIDQARTGYTLSASAPGLTDATSAAFDVVTAGPGRIAFASNRDGNNEIYSMNADGSGVVRLTLHLASGGEPAWSPDGRKIAFANGISIYAMNADGSGVTALADSVRYPAWSPDGTRIAGSRGIRVCRIGCGIRYARIFVMNLDGSGLVVLTSGTTPAWSPDGRIAFAYSGNISVMNPDGSGLINLTNDPASDIYPAWSPDGTKIAFVSDRGGAYDLYVMNADGTAIVQLTSDPAIEGRPAWSPDGAKIAFASNGDGDSEIYLINVDGSGVIQLTANSTFDGWPAWAP
jgi:TolB protein